MLAYLVIREGAKWTDVFRLMSGQTVTIGRAPSNQIVIKDDRCSRYHAEVYLSEGSWKVRDLESRNGTIVNNQPLKDPYELKPGDVIKIGRSQLAFVHDLSKAFPDSSSLIVKEFRDDYRDDQMLVETQPIPPTEPTEIRHRQAQSAILATSPEEGISTASAAAVHVLRLARQFAMSSDLSELAEHAVISVLSATKTSTGAILLFPRDAGPNPSYDDLEVIACRTPEGTRYQRVSSVLANAVLQDKEAVLAGAQVGVICAPIRGDDQIYGLLHVSSSQDGTPLGESELEFCLAVADVFAPICRQIVKQEDLSDRVGRMQDENRQLREGLSAESEIIGKSLAITRVSEQISQAAAGNAPVLIHGERGVGKELVARAIHFASSRAKGPFLSLSCATLEENELDSELFGHEKGAFEDATSRKIGKLEAADQGTLLLGEIGDLSPNQQAKLLRVLEDHPFERVGGTAPIKVDVRLIATTKRDLEREVAEGRFRQDLYLRLHQLEIVVPNLRQRSEDIPVLAQHFLEHFRAAMGRRLKGFTLEAMELMQDYRWPGNVRELKNVIERAVLLARGDYLDQDDLILSTQSSTTAEAES